MVFKRNIVCEGFVISKKHESYTFMLKSLFKVYSTRTSIDLYNIYRWIHDTYNSSINW